MSDTASTPITARPVSCAGVVYMITNHVNGKTYIGVTRQRPANRWSGHKCDARKGIGNMLHQAMRKYGLDQFSFSVVASAVNLESLPELERILILQTNSHADFHMGYNLTLGGYGVEGPSQSTRALMRAAKLNRPLSKEHAAMISAGNKGVPKSPEHIAKVAAAVRQRAPYTRLPRSQASREKASRTLKGRSPSLAAIEAGRAANLGKKHTAESRAKIGAARVGIPRPAECVEKTAAAHRGMKRSDQSKAKMSLAQKARFAAIRRFNGGLA